MTPALWLVSGTTVALLLLLVWALRGGRDRKSVV